ncbi:hypothetical protein NDU88_005374 [Pleurodeles waltl]|uniref:Uncharacterized protein n=1 Tax=Pleurodeles waltl TaxID=8319 RepID=A0AAV7QL01_PLEWA|nr:hypothetical protein NDU88_005374 [Pleurodeles waltl]
MLITYQGQTKEYSDPYNLESFLNDLEEDDSGVERKSTPSVTTPDSSSDTPLESYDPGQWETVPRKWTSGSKFKTEKGLQQRDKSRLLQK